MDLGALAWVERTNKIIETEAVFTGGLFYGFNYAQGTLPKRLYGLHRYYLCLSNPKVIRY
jgi:hypothetical protein